MKLSRESQYGLRGMVALARLSEGQVTMLGAIAKAEGLSYSFLSKIFQKLSQHGLVTAHRGLQRGYSLARRPAHINVREILEAIEGPDLGERCLIWDRECVPGRRCLVHSVSEAAGTTLIAGLARTTLAALAAPPRPARTGRSLRGK